MYLSVNDAFTKLTGLRDVVGRKVTEVIPTIRAMHPELLETYGRVATTGWPERLEIEFTPLGLWLSISVYCPQKGYFTAVFDNITARKQAEEALAASRNQLQNIIDNTPALIFVRDLEERFVVANRALAELLNSSPERMIGKKRIEFMPETTAAQHEANDREVIEAGNALEFEEYGEFQGRAITSLATKFPLPDAQGRINAVAGISAEITERKRMEEALRESEERFRTLADANPLIIWVIDQAGRVQFINRAFREFFGTSLEKVQAEGWQMLVHPDDTPTYTKPFFGSLREHKPYHAEGRVRRYDGQWCWIESWGEPRFSASGEFLGIAGSSADVSERKEAEDALRELNATLENRVMQRTAELQHRARQLQKLTLQLSQAEEQERRRIATILHEDLQQQIAGAKFHLSLVRNRAKEDGQRADIDAVDTMLKDAIEKSRTLSRDLSPAVLHMNDLAEVLEWLANRMRAQQGLDVQLDLSGDMMLHSEALATFLFRATQELLFNVVKHAHVREASVRVRRIRRSLCLSVSDQGRGFDVQELKETPGMGLFSIRERTELLGGRMKVKSAKGQGSRCSLMVPDGPKPKDREQTTEDGRQTGEDGLPCSVFGHPSSGPALRVLLVDDHDVVRAGLAAMLREAPGIELVGEAPDGREAVNLANALQPDVVIMDVSMPLMSGDEATRQIKILLPQTRVIALSMYDEAEKKEKMFEAGAEGYILKTVSAEELLAAIRDKEPDA